MNPAMKLVLPLMPLIVGVTFALAGLLRPALLWDNGKLQAGRRLLGDGPMATCLIVFGLLLIGVAVFTFVRLRDR